MCTGCSLRVNVSCRRSDGEFANIPLLIEEGWLRIKKRRVATFDSADGVVKIISDHPVRSYLRMPSAIFLGGRVHPSSMRRGIFANSRSRRLGNNPFMLAFKFHKTNSLFVLERGHKARGYTAA
jgi:hypothetical protein